MPNLNKVFFIGNITRDLDLRYLPAGTAAVNFGIAVNRQWESQDGEKKEETCFLDVTAFGRRAEVITEHFKKGDPIFIEGRLKLEQWETQDGQKRSKVKVICENFQFIGSKGGSKNEQ